MSIVHGSSPSSGAGGPLRLATLALAALAVAGAVVVVVWPLPKPAAGGTCGPGSGSEPAIAAFFDPASIGAGPQPTSSAVEAYQWQAFVGECQSSANGRMVEGLALLLVGALFGLVLHPLVRRAWHEPAPAGGGLAGWHGEPTAAWHWPPEAHTGAQAPAPTTGPPAEPVRWPPPVPESQQPPAPGPGAGPPPPPADQP